jgi:glyoxylase-like metal-dependent hydrolase (beta-lactamase superfamily II)
MITHRRHTQAVGAFTAHIFHDGGRTLSAAELDNLFPAHGAALRALDPAPSFEIGRNILLLQRDQQRILIDTGEGALVADKPGHLWAALHAHGFALDSITDVILTHCHGDHIGGLVQEGAPMFPNARLTVPQAEYDHWTRADVLATLTEARAAALRAIFADGQYTPRLLPPDAEITNGIRYVAAHGHSPGHAAVLIESRGARLLHVADAWHIAAQTQLPAAAVRFDVDATAAAASRRALLARAAQDDMLTLAFHLPYPGLGHVLHDGEAYRWRVAVRD